MSYAILYITNSLFERSNILPLSILAETTSSGDYEDTLVESTLCRTNPKYVDKGNGGRARC
jgi:hypothetical protein